MSVKCRCEIPSSVGVLDDKSSSTRILEDNFEVLGLGPVTQVLGNTRGHTLHQSLLCCVLLKVVLKDL